MARKYEALWLRIRDAAFDQWVTVTLADWSVSQTVINMVQLEKTKANTTRKRLDLPAFGKLVIEREPEKKVLKFRLNGAGHQL